MIVTYDRKNMFIVQAMGTVLTTLHFPIPIFQLDNFEADYQWRERKNNTEKSKSFRNFLE